MGTFWFETCVVTVILLQITLVSSNLVCYQCDRMNSNWGTCTAKRRVCETYQDACTTYMRWRIPNYWTQRGERVYEISKDCDTRQACERRQLAISSVCRRTLYHDWACVDCCTGDLCNFYVTYSSGRQLLPSSLLSTATLASFFLFYFNRFLL